MEYDKQKEICQQWKIESMRCHSAILKAFVMCEEGIEKDLLDDAWMCYKTNIFNEIRGIF